LNSYVGRVPYQKPLRGDRPVKISAISGAENREVYPSKERSWLPYFLKNVPNPSQLRENVHSRGGSIVSTGTPSNPRPPRNVNITPNKVPVSAVHAQTFTPHSPAADHDEEDDKPIKIKVNLPTVTTTSSASPAVSDSSSLHVHHPRPQKHINIADIDDSSARLKAMLNPSTSSPAHSHERTSSTVIPETAVHAAPFQPTTFLPTTQQPQFSNLPYYYPQPFPVQNDFPNTTTQPYFVQQPRYEQNGMVYYYDPSYYYFQPSSSGTPPQNEQAETSNSNMYYYPNDPQRMGMYFPYSQGT
jgi:hypothetical protein